MASIERELKTKGVIMALLTLVLMNIGCEDKIDNLAANSSEGETVEVTLNIGLADEEDGAGANASPVSKASGNGNSRSAFEVVPVSDIQTKADEGKPDQLYNLEIWQYNIEGSKIGGQALNTVTIGSALSVSLAQATGCKLLLVARGATADFSSLSGKSLSDLQGMTVVSKTSQINAIPTDATGGNLANMTYYLLLEDINITSAGKIESPAGKDVRLMLKRLAVKVQLDWAFAQEMINKNYTLKEVKLCQVPAHYRLVPKTEATDRWGDVYPTSVAEFVDIFRLTGDELVNAHGTKTVWIPANARGFSAYATSPIYRNKENANAAATYAEFVVDNSEKKERLYYRAYLGGNETNDFNLLENKNYHWTVNINNANYTSDPRIQLLDQTPVISSNMQTTSNCFMMKPGTNICFNPYKHEAGTDGWNTYLTTSGSIKSDKQISHVKVLWQTKDAGTSGDLVMGYAINNDKGRENHENLVNITEGDNVSNARIHVKVPVTNGGNAVIAAYSSSNIIVWSWHLWISNYVPVLLNSNSITSDETRSAAIIVAQTTSLNGTVHAYQGAPWISSTGSFYKKVIMDRDLGALRSMPSQTGSLDAARTFGMLYQWGRKDPILGSADGTGTEIDVIFDGDGVSKVIRKEGSPSLDKIIADPSAFYTNCMLSDNSWGPDDKTIYDPCPAGWRVPDFNANQSSWILAGFGSGTPTDYISEPKGPFQNIRILNGGYWVDTNETTKEDVTNGFLYLYPGQTPDNYDNQSVWFPSFRKREHNTGNLRDPGTGSSYNPLVSPSYSMASARATGSGNPKSSAICIELKSHAFYLMDTKTSNKGYGLVVRCIQN